MFQMADALANTNSCKCSTALGPPVRASAQAWCLNFAEHDQQQSKLHTFGVVPNMHALFLERSDVADQPKAAS
jgi:hypothetical protein